MELVELEITRRGLLSCNRCPRMVESRQEVMGKNHYPIPFLYTDDSQIMLVGIAPGRLKQGHSRTKKDEHAFKMGSGKILFDVISELGIDEKYFHITNIVKCTTPQDGKFNPDDVKTCVQLYLLREIRIIKPMLIIVLGNKAKELFNKYVNIDNLNVQYLYHPAAATRGSVSYTAFKNRFIRILETAQ